MFKKPAIFLICFLCCINIATSTHAQVLKGDSIVPLTLEQAIDLGIKNSYTLKAANITVDIASENIKQRRSDQLPGIDLGVDGFLINDPILYNESPFGDPQKIDYSPFQVSGNLAVTEVIYAGNRISNSINQQVLQKKIAEFAATKTSTDAKLDVIREYLQLFNLVKDYNILTYTIGQVELRLKTLRSKYRNGQVVKNDVSRSELQKSEFELRLMRTVSNASATNYLLTLMLGLPDNVIIQVDTTVDYTSDTIFNFDECLQAALDNRPEYLIAKTNKELSENSYKLAKAGYYPTINAIGLYGLQNPVPGTFPPEAKFLSYLTVGAGLKYSLGSLYKLNHQRSSAELAILVEQENVNEMESQIRQQVKTQYTKYELQRQSLSIYEEKILFAEENYRIIASRYYNDMALISDMVDAELEYNQAKLELIKNKVQTREEYYNLLKVIGKL